MIFQECEPSAVRMSGGIGRVPEPSIWAGAAGAHPRRLEQSVVSGNGCIPGTKVYAGVSEEVQVSPKLVNCGSCRNSSAMVATCVVSDTVKGLYVRGDLKMSTRL